jgi:glycerophosphoryl diester phosphodiesterase
VQSFDAGSLRALRHVLRVPLVQLVDTSVTPAGPALAEIATYADVVALNKDAVVARRADGTLGAATGVVERAHAAGLLVHCFTFRNENHFLPADLRSGVHPEEHGDASAEYRMFLNAGVDGVFSDNPDTAAAAVSAHGGGRRITTGAAASRR